MTALPSPSVSTSNAEELLFDRIDSGYIVSVATNEGTGRSATAQLLHASEAAFWSDLPLQMASLMQTVPDLPGTEIIIESTANGYNDFHSQWRNAEAGESEFLPVFLSWSLDAAYRKELPEGFAMDAEESKLAASTKNRLRGGARKFLSSAARSIFRRNTRSHRATRLFRHPSTASFRLR
ncbi:MAG: hypothetical protein WCC81_23840 [Pseudolabrys sp.]